MRKNCHNITKIHSQMTATISHLMLLSLMLSLLTGKARAQEPSIILDQVTSADDLVDGETYLISSAVGEKTTPYAGLKMENFGLENYPDVFNAFTDNYYATPEEAAENSELFQWKTVNGKHCLYNVDRQRFLGYFTATFVSGFLLSDTLSEACEVTVDETDGEINLLFGTKRYLRYAKEERRYRFYTNVKQKSPITIFHVKPDSALQLGDEGISGSLHTTADVVFHHTFHDNYYNTLYLPFGVADYNATFGDNVKAYQLEGLNGYRVTFSEMASNSPLEANKPYLLRGTFGGRDTFKMYNVRIDADGPLPDAIDGDSLSIQGVYSPLDLSHNDRAFVLYQDHFVYCNQQESLSLSSFRWYLSLSQSASTGAKTISFEDIPLDIRPLHATSSRQGIYTLDGRKLSLDESSLPKGIYIINGKKVVK